MPHYIAFLRAINVGGHTVKMDRLRQIFENLGCLQVETFIASGNVIFESAGSEPEIAALLAEGLQHELGYPVATFIRTPQEVVQVAAYQPFSSAELTAAAALNIAFLAEPPSDAACQRLLAMKNGIDDFNIHNRQVYWLCQKKQSESTFSNVLLEKTLRQQATIRGINTIQRLAARF